MILNGQNDANVRNNKSKTEMEITTQLIFPLEKLRMSKL